jgi:hypothetical protein
MKAPTGAFFLTMHSEFKTTIEYLDKLKLHILLIPGEVLTQSNDNLEKGKFNQRFVIQLDGKVEWQGGVVALGEGNGYITVSSARMKQLDVERYDEVHVKLTKDKSEFGHEFPQALAEIFRQDIAIEKRFKDLAPGKQRTIIYYINQPKSLEKQIERAWLYMTNLMKLPEGKETMKGLFGKE